MFKFLKERIDRIGLVQTAFSRSKPIGYMAVHTYVFVSKHGSFDISELQDVLSYYCFTPLSTSHHEIMQNVRFSSYVCRNNIHAIIMHSEDGELISLTIQFLDD